MTALMFGGNFRFDLKNPDNPNNDRLIFSKGHASPLFYAIWTVAVQKNSPNSPLPLFNQRGGAGGVQEGEGGVQPVTPEELLTLRKFGSRLEGHPTMAFPYTEAATGSLGQGLSIGVGMALNAKLDKLPYRTFVLLGDSEMAEGSVWEAIQLAAHYKLDNLIGILDVNRLGQRGETMYGHHLEEYEKRIKAFGWDVIVVENGHDLEEITQAYSQVIDSTSPLPPPLPFDSAQGRHLPLGQGEKRIEARGGGRPWMIIAKTIKGKGVSFIEDKDGWHGKALSAEELEKALQELGEVDKSVRREISSPSPLSSPVQGEERVSTPSPLAGEGWGEGVHYSKDKPVATRKAYGNALVRIGADPRIVVLDGEVSNSTYAEKFKEKYPERFFEMFIAEQNMVGAALGLSRRGKIPFVSTFAAFFTRAFDQIRMSQYSDANIKFCGSHAGVSIGEDGASQMGLEDLAMFRTLLDSVVLYPSDAVSTEKLVEETAKHHGIVYIRTTRKDTPIIYDNNNNYNHNFKIGGSCVLRSSSNDVATVVAAGITLHEALAAYDELQKEGINIRVIDLYSVKPLDIATLQKAAAETKAIITVEDHFAEGGIGEAVSAALSSFPSLERGGREGEVDNLTWPPATLSSSGEGYSVARLHSLCVRKMPRSGKPDELLDYEGISRNTIVKKVKEVI